jgi:hypothetical protein
MSLGEVGHAISAHHPNELRYATPTGSVLIRWDGARQPTIWMVDPPEMDARAARLELARRYLHLFGPGTPASFSDWAGIKPRWANAAFEALRGDVMPARTPVGAGWILATDEASFRSPPEEPAPGRLLPSGDVYYLLQGPERALLVPDAEQRSRLWTTRVWPGAVLVAGEIVGTWRRSNADVTVTPWRPLSPREREEVEAEASALPLPEIKRGISVRWDT